MASKRLLDTPEKKKNEPPKKSAAVSADEPMSVAAHAAASGGESNKAPEWFNAYLFRFDELINRIDSIAKRSIENESKIDACCIQVDTVAEAVSKLQAENEELRSKIDDLENRSRRTNLVLHGIPEKSKENCEGSVVDFFSNFVGLETSDYSIERCHRTPTIRKEESTGPRIIHVAFTTFAMKEKVRKASIAKLKGGAQYQGKKIYVSEDFSQRVLRARQEKQDHMKRLREEGKKPFFVYPAKIAYRNKDGKLILAEK